MIKFENILIFYLVIKKDKIALFLFDHAWYTNIVIYYSNDNI